MSEQNQQELESLSALMDSEADDLELRRILKACEQRPELMQTWERYHLAQAALHGSARQVSPDLSTRIAAQIAAESTPIATMPTFSGWQQHLSKIAIAASVAVIFIVGIQTDFTSDTAPALVQQGQINPVSAESAATPVTLLASDTIPVSLDPAAQQRLHDYIERMTFDEKEPVITEHFQDSPLYRLVNEFGVKPQ